MALPGPSISRAWRRKNLGSLAAITPEWLATQHPGAQFRVYGSGVEQRRVDHRMMTMRHYVSWLRATEHVDNADTWYLGENYALAEKFGMRGLLKPYVEPFLPRHPMLQHTALWLGPRGSTTGLHCDPDGVNLLCLLHGRKVFHIFPPSETPLLAMSRRFDSGARSSAIDLFADDVETRFPQLSRAKRMRVEMEPGDILYVPRWWWHAVENLDVTVAVSYRAETVVTAALNVPTLVKNVLHDAGLYRRGNCTCHVNGA